MSETTTTICPVKRNHRNANLDKFRIAGMPRISTRTLAGLLQAYAVAEQVIPYLCPKPGRVREAIESPKDSERYKKAIFLLQAGSRGINCLECLEDGSPDALENLKALLLGLTRDLYKEAERA